VVTVTDPARAMAEMIITQFADESQECANRWIAEATGSVEMPEDFKEMYKIAFQTGYMTAIRNHMLGG